MKNKNRKTKKRYKKREKNSAYEVVVPFDTLKFIMRTIKEK